MLERLRKELGQVKKEVNYHYHKSPIPKRLKGARENRDLLCFHPRYKRQFKKDLLYGALIAGIFFPGLVGTTVYAFGYPERSEERAAKACATITCREDIPKALAPLSSALIKAGLDASSMDPEEYLKQFPRPSRTEIKAELDSYYRLNDFAPIAAAGGLCLAGTLGGAGYVVRTIRRDHLRRKALRLNNARV